MAKVVEEKQKEASPGEIQLVKILLWKEPLEGICQRTINYFTISRLFF